MRGYAEASSLPSTEIRGTTIPRLILGHLPFLGESYQGPGKNREYLKRFSNKESIVEVLCKAVEEYGVTVAAAAPSTEGRPAALYLEAVREAMGRTGVEIALIPCLRIPLTIDGKPIDDYRRWLTYYGIERRLAGGEILRRYLEDPILLCREGWGEKFPHALAHLDPYGGEDLRRLEVDYERLRQAVLSLEGLNTILVELGSETDLLAMAGRLDLLSELVDWLRGTVNRPVLLGSHHAGSTIPILEESTVGFEGYVTPVNSLGVMMFPTQEMAVEAIKGAGKPVIAIKPLAGGRIPPSEALEYVYRDVGVDACMIGVASQTELDEDLEAALEKMLV
ncbi:MAG: hypothetical protein ACE5GD_06885 [Candidatus Geothermarchaeales archaeon]